jgi:hypothetical protein
MSTDFWDVIAAVWYMENLKIKFILQVLVHPTNIKYNRQLSIALGLEQTNMTPHYTFSATHVCNTVSQLSAQWAVPGVCRKENLMLCSVALEDTWRLKRTFICIFSDRWTPCHMFRTGLYCIKDVWELIIEL